MSVHFPAGSVSSACNARDPATPGLAVRTVCERADQDAVVVIVVAGELDGVGALRLQSAWDASMESSPARVVLDLREVDSCDAAGLQVLAGMSAACRAHGLRLQLSTRGRLDWLLLLVGLAQDSRTQTVADQSPRDTTGTGR